MKKPDKVNRQALLPSENQNLQNRATTLDASIDTAFLQLSLGKGRSTRAVMASLKRKYK